MTPATPTKTAAHQAVKAAIKNGKLVPGSCEHADYGICKGVIQAHHDDYTKPLEVRWLCRRHHTRFHVDHPGLTGGQVQVPYSNGARGGSSRTVRSRIPRDLEARLDAEMERDERTESDIVRRALNAYLPRLETK